MFRMNFGGEVSYKNIADGWAKFNKFNIDNTGVSSVRCSFFAKVQVRMSSKFMKSATYQKCEAAAELVPQMTMGPIVSKWHCTVLHLIIFLTMPNPQEPDNWGMMDMADIGEQWASCQLSLVVLGT
jgi:hypothetical protein